MIPAGEETGKAEKIRVTQAKFNINSLKLESTKDLYKVRLNNTFQQEKEYTKNPFKIESEIENTRELQHSVKLQKASL